MGFGFEKFNRAIQPGDHPFFSTHGTWLAARGTGTLGALLGSDLVGYSGLGELAQKLSELPSGSFDFVEVRDLVE